MVDIQSPTAGHYGIITFRVSRRRREMYIGHARLSVRVSVRRRIPTVLHGRAWLGVPPSCALLGGFAIGAWVSLLWQHSPNAKCQRVRVLAICLVVIVAPSIYIRMRRNLTYFLVSATLRSPTVVNGQPTVVYTIDRVTWHLRGRQIAWMSNDECRPIKTAINSGRNVDRLPVLLPGGVGSQHACVPLCDLRSRSCGRYIDIGGCGGGIRRGGRIATRDWRFHPAFHAEFFHDFPYRTCILLVGTDCRKLVPMWCVVTRTTRLTRDCHLSTALCTLIRRQLGRIDFTQRRVYTVMRNPLSRVLKSTSETFVTSAS